MSHDIYLKNMTYIWKSPKFAFFGFTKKSQKVKNLRERERKDFIFIYIYIMLTLKIFEVAVGDAQSLCIFVSF